MRIIFVIAVSLILVSSFIYCESENRFPITVKDGLGRQVTIKSVPQKIVSTIPSNTEILYDLDLKDKVIAVTSHCGKTCDISGKDIIGGWAQPEIVEKIERLKPDLVLGFGGLQSPLASEMDKRNIPTFIFFPKTVNEILEQTLLVGKITGTTPKATEVVRKCQKNLSAIEKKFKDIPLEKRLKCLRLMSTEAMVIGGASFQNDIIKKAGGINVFENIDEAYPIVGLNDVREKDPDMIILNRDNEKKAIEWFLEQEGWRDLRAAREGRLISISCDYICHPNTRIDKTVEMLAKRFYPEKFVPTRIVSLNPSATEIIYALKADKNLIAVTQFCPFPELLKEKGNIGTILDPDIEKIISLKPDIVFATVEGNRQSSINNLRNAGIKVLVLDDIHNFNDIYKRIDMMGEMLRAENESNRLISEMKKKIEEIENKVAKKARLNVFIQLGAEPLVTVNNNTIINEMISIAGGENIAKDALMRYPKYSREAVIMQNPDVIIIVSMGKFGEEALKKWRTYKSLKAVQNNKICIIDSNVICHMGPRLIEGVQKMAKFLHPEEF